ncbi:MFS transporter [Streptomyces tagetis]|uniref:Aromatic acid/H+ symport family MFS transporter n=1 Tax=Streptomyces tagetis TaxID=2820809 RepID=A0A940X8S8_9ACTN|nr:aromatic acid/H+ symport family MFS transporter [Streptomyces sp. RG38]MBQ0825393.1 aromatic acid/H+ symport family MFS transporter [Streptomyces sp. RG38]
MSAPGTTARRSTHWVLLICCLTVIFDGYDLIVYGTIVPDLLAYKEWDLTPSEVGHIGSLTLVGMLIGALGVGTITDVLGRRKVMIGCLIWFSVAMPITALAPDPGVFMLLRFITGLGLGGVVPTAIALTMEYSPEGRRQLNNSLMFSGYSVGGVLAALLALWLLPVAGFRAMFVVGVAPLFIVLPLALRMLPESIAYLTAKGRLDEAAMYARRFGVPGPGVPGPGGETAPAAPAASAAPGKAAGVLDILRTLVGGQRLVMTLLVWAISIIGLLLVYGLNTWLPQFMRGAGYSMGSALTFLLVFNIGAVAGVIIAGALADRLGEKLVIACSFCLAAVAVCLFITKPSTLPLLMVGALAGFGSNTQTLVNAFVGGLYPPTARATALGWALGVGRIGGIIGPTYGGYVLTKVETGSLGDNWVFYAFAIPAVVAAALTVLVPRRPWAPLPTAATEPPVPATRSAATGD